MTEHKEGVGKGDEVGFSRKHAWQLSEASLCLQSSKEQWGSNPFPGQGTVFSLRALSTQHRPAPALSSAPPQAAGAPQLGAAGRVSGCEGHQGQALSKAALSFTV